MTFNTIMWLSVSDLIDMIWIKQFGSHVLHETLPILCSHLGLWIRHLYITYIYQNYFNSFGINGSVCNTITDLEQRMSHAQSAHVITIIQFKHGTRRYCDKHCTIGVFLQETKHYQVLLKNVKHFTKRRKTTQTNRQQPARKFNVLTTVSGLKHFVPLACAWNTDHSVLPSSLS